MIAAATAAADDFAHRRFRTAADHYLAGRPPYAAGLINRVAELTRLGPDDRVMDLGCGPGQLARAFAPRSREVLALDPEPEMLRVAQAASAASDRIIWQQAGSADLSPAMGRFRLITMGRSFHWMDRDETLRRLDGIIEPGGVIVLFHDTHPAGPDNAWYEAYRDTLRRYGGSDTYGARTRAADWLRHEVILLRSAFSRVEEIGVYERRPASIDGMIERALSMSSTSRARLGDQADAMVSDLRAILPGGEFHELIVSHAMLAWRPQL